DEASVERLMRSLRKEATREVVWSGRNRTLRSIGSLAACLLVGFIVGRGMHHSTPSSPMAPIAPLADPGGLDRVAVAPPSIPTISPMKFDGPRVNPNVLPNPFRIAAPPLATVSVNDPFPGYLINVVDRNGNIVRRFDSHEQYMKFVE